MSATPTGSYGPTMAERFRAERSTSFASILRGQTFAVTRISRTKPQTERIASLPAEPVLSFGHQLVDRGNIEMWYRNRHVRTGKMPAGTLSMVDFETEPSSWSDGIQDVVLFYVPRSALDTLSVERGGGTVTELAYGPGVPVVDPIARDLGLAFLPVLAEPGRASRLFFDYVGLAFQEHVLHRYVGLRKPMKAIAGKLAPWQEQRAAEVIAANLDGDLSLERLAAECRLSRAHFVRGFKQTFGTSPHRWLTRRRVDAAKALMHDPALSLAEIAARCGFANQSHFSRVFRKYEGASPDTWRRDRSPIVVVRR